MGCESPCQCNVWAMVEGELLVQALARKVLAPSLSTSPACCYLGVSVRNFPHRMQAGLCSRFYIISWFPGGVRSQGTKLGAPGVPRHCLLVGEYLCWWDRGVHC